MQGFRRISMMYGCYVGPRGKAVVTYTVLCGWHWQSWQSSLREEVLNSCPCMTRTPPGGWVVTDRVGLDMESCLNQNLNAMDRDRKWPADSQNTVWCLQPGDLQDWNTMLWAQKRSYRLRFAERRFYDQKMWILEILWLCMCYLTDFYDQSISQCN